MRVKRIFHPPPFLNFLLDGMTYNISKLVFSFFVFRFFLSVISPYPLPLVYMHIGEQVPSAISLVVVMLYPYLVLLCLSVCLSIQGPSRLVYRAPQGASTNNVDSSKNKSRRIKPPLILFTTGLCRGGNSRAEICKYSYL